MPSKVRQWIIDIATPVAEAAGRAAAQELAGELRAQVTGEVALARQDVEKLAQSIEGLPNQVLEALKGLLPFQIRGGQL